MSHTNSIRNQLLATVYANFLSLTYGGVCGWPSSNILILQSDASPLLSGKLSIEEASWITSFICVGGILGNLFYGWISNRYGRKIPMLSITVPFMIGWLLIVFAENSTYLFISRFFLGFCGGGTFVFVPIYVTEISNDKVRGFLGSLLVLMCNIGMLLAYILGNYVSYTMFPIIFLVFPITFFIGFIFLPETPEYLFKKGDNIGGEKSLRFYRNIRRQSTQQEIELLKTEMYKYRNYNSPHQKNELTTSLTIRDFNYPAAKKAFLIGIVLVALNQLNGSFAMLNYTATIFKESGSNLTPNMSAIVIGIIQAIGTLISTFLVERAGRKLLIGVSALGISIGLSGLGTYVYLKSMGYNLDSYGWVPVFCFSFSIFIASFGVLNLPFLVIAELMPAKIRSFGTSTCMTVLWIFAFFMIKFFPIFSAAYGMHTCFFTFAGISLAGSIFIFCVLPETKGKNFEEILESLGGR